MSQQSEVLFERLKLFSLRCVRLYTHLPKTREANVIGTQLLRSGTSVGAHYAEARRAKSDADYKSKIEGGMQELEEVRYWMELLSMAGIVEKDRLVDLIRESDELMAIHVTIIRKVKSKLH